MTTTARVLTFFVMASVVPGCANLPRPPKSQHADSSSAPFTVIHKAPTGGPLAKPPFRYVDYYRTEVQNVSDRPLKIVWFEGYTEVDGSWRPGNVLGRVLREEEFSAWYTEGDTVTHGTIPPGATAVCDVNWHGSNSPAPMKSKWAFIAVDGSGNDYFVESVVDPSLVERVDHGARAAMRPSNPPMQRTGYAGR